MELNNMAHDNWGKTMDDKLAKKGPSGLTDNLGFWKDYAKGNSVSQGPIKAQSRRDLSEQDCKSDYASGTDDAPKQQTSEGRGINITNALAAKSSYTGKGGSERD